MRFTIILSFASVVQLPSTSPQATFASTMHCTRAVVWAPATCVQAPLPTIQPLQSDRIAHQTQASIWDNDE